MLIVSMQLCLKFAVNIKETGWLKKENIDRPWKTLKSQYSKLKAIFFENSQNKWLKTGISVSNRTKKSAEWNGLYIGKRLMKTSTNKLTRK